MQKSQSALLSVQVPMRKNNLLLHNRPQSLTGLNLHMTHHSAAACLKPLNLKSSEACCSMMEWTHRGGL